MSIRHRLCAERSREAANRRYEPNTDDIVRIVLLCEVTAFFLNGKANRHQLRIFRTDKPTTNPRQTSKETTPNGRPADISKHLMINVPANCRQEWTEIARPFFEFSPTTAVIVSSDRLVVFSSCEIG